MFSYIPALESQTHPYKSDPVATGLFWMWNASLIVYFITEGAAGIWREPI